MANPTPTNQGFLYDPRQMLRPGGVGHFYEQLQKELAKQPRGRNTTPGVKMGNWKPLKDPGPPKTMVAGKPGGPRIGFAWRV